MGMKYIRLEQLGKAQDTIVVFPMFISHNDMVDHLGLEKKDVFSAGFVRVDKPKKKDGNPEMVCYGHSESLDLQADKYDSRILNLQMHGRRGMKNDR